MKFVIQRVKNASVTIEGNLYSKIGHGLLILFCAEKGDTEADLAWYINKILKLRIFEDEEFKMNRSLVDIGGEILAVSQFTLAANCKKGTRPSFDSAMEPVCAKKMYEKFVEELQKEGQKQFEEAGQKAEFTVKTGVFAADMKVSLLNDGPVTIIL